MAPVTPSPPVTPTPYHRPTPTPDSWTYGPRPTREPYYDDYHHERPIKYETHFHIYGRSDRQFQAF